ncbi:MAG: alpha/beta hydrolase-fold protein, partial [Planctomycetota bacterium]
VASFDADNASWYLDAPLPQTKYLLPGVDAWPSSPPTRSQFTTFFFDEFIPYIDREYRSEPKQRMLTGFSMGGYGAFHYLLSRPEAFVSISALSGAFRSMTQPNKALVPLIGEHPQESVRYRAVDLQLRLIDAVLRKVPLPPIFIHCGTEDSGLIENNRDFARFLTALNIPARYLETAGEHNWPFWRDASPGIVDFHWRSLHPVQ